MLMIRAAVVSTLYGEAVNIRFFSKWTDASIDINARNRFTPAP